MNNGSVSELTRSDYTEFIYDKTCFGDPIDPESAEDVIEGISRAIALDSSPAFQEGLSARLTELGTVCTPEDKDVMLSEIKRRFKELLDKPCPKAIQNWIKGTTPGITNRQNNYDLCYALEMDFKQTAVFFQKYFLTMPFNAKSKTDAVFMYCLYHNRPYVTAQKMLDQTKGFVSQENAHTATSQIISTIFETDDDDKFMRYLSEHCYDNEQQYQLARKIINDEIGTIQKRLLRYESDRILSPDRLGSLTIETLLGFKSQRKGRRSKESVLPKRFTGSLPNDVTLGKIINGAEVSYELLRKTLVLVKFYNFYFEADNTDRNTIAGYLMDFYEELNSVLVSCGFAQLYLRHPFDCLMLYCANSYDPIDALYCVMANRRN